MTQASRKIRVAVIGLGWVALHRHIPALRRNKAFEIVGVIDRHPARAADVARQWNIPHFAQSEAPEGLASLDWFGAVDAVVIATPPMTHAALAHAAIDLGKDVMVEKPFALKLEDGKRVVEAAKAQGRILAITHNFQFARAMEKIERDLAAGRLGEVRRIAAVQLGNPKRRLPRWYEELPMGLFYDESPHFFYLLRRLGGGPLELQHAHAVAMPEGTRTPALAGLMYRNAQNVPITVSCQFDAAVSEWHIMVSGTKAVGIVDIFRDIYVRLPNDGEHGLLQILRTSWCAFAQHFAQHIPNGLAFLKGRLDYGNEALYARFAEAVLGRKAEALKGMGAEDALAVLKLQQDAIAALRNNLLT